METLTVAVLQKEIDTVKDRVDVLHKDMQWVKTTLHQNDIDELKREQRMKDLIVSAVTEGNKESAAALQNMNAQIIGLLAKTEERIASAEKRIITLEGAEDKRILDEAKQKKEEKKERRKQIFWTALACCITGTIGFFLSIFLNQIWLVLSK